MNSTQKHKPNFMKIVLKIIFFLIFIISCKEERYKNEISDFRKELRPSLESLSNEESLPTNDTVARNFLEENATKDELIKLMDSKNPLLRIIAYKSIVNRQEPEYFDLLLGHLSDTARVNFWVFEDELQYKQASDLMIRIAHFQNGLSPIQKKYLVEKVLLEHPYLNISTWMIQDINPDEKYYNLIKSRAQTKREFCRDQLSACYALSKFKKNVDVDLLYKIFDENLKNFECIKLIFRSIETFPNEKFYSLLERYFEMKIKGKLSSKENINDEVLYFSRAVASYKNQNAVSILKYIERNNTYINHPYWPPANKKYVYKAMLINYDPVYDDLIQQLQKEFDKEELDRIGYLRRDLIEPNEKLEW